ncbi:MAG TPA: DNA repair protein RecN [Solirubrobacteraceae bacterium]|nr:DNA repair protein RecN [Solirubrobacteraceae bacterium]
MLQELRVENLLLMERAELRLAPGLNILTGETGAGKTLLAHALDLLLGGRARRGIVRADAREAYVEGVFSLPAGLAGDERLPDGAGELVLARRVWPDGRTRAYVCGRAATQADLQQLGGRLLSFYGQHEHRRLMLSAAQLDLLDAFCGAEQSRRRSQMAALHAQVRELEARAAALRRLEGQREREADLLSFELREIEQAAPGEEEQRALIAERERLRHREALIHAAAGALAALTGAAADGAERAERGPAAVELLASGGELLDHVGRLDERLAALAQRLQALRYEAEDVALELRGSLEGLAGEGAADVTARLEQIEERLAALVRLERKHGGSIAAVLEHAQRCRARLEELTHAQTALDEVERRLERVAAARERLAGELSAARRSAAPELAAAVRARLAELAMEGARFEIDLTQRADGFGSRGADAIEMRIAAAPGVPAGPLREVASGGELSRVMLALLSVAHGGADDAADAGQARQRTRELLVFDEVDAGIGGHTARAVGEHLRRLARSHQILCITHLPQVAALADRHFTIVKDASATPATTTVTELSGDEVVGELVRMLGGASGDRGASEHARELLRAA